MSYFRRAGRKRSNYAVQFIRDETVSTLATTKDVSSSGMFVTMPGLEKQSRFFVGDTLKVNLYSAEHLVESTSIEVVRVTDEGFGCHFL